MAGWKVFYGLASVGCPGLGHNFSEVLFFLRDHASNLPYGGMERWVETMVMVSAVTEPDGAVCEFS